MSKDRPDLSIDLHKLAAQNGEGLAPELFCAVRPWPKF